MCTIYICVLIWAVCESPRSLVYSAQAGYRLHRSLSISRLSTSAFQHCEFTSSVVLIGKWVVMKAWRVAIARRCEFSVLLSGLPSSGGRDNSITTLSGASPIERKLNRCRVPSNSAARDMNCTSDRVTRRRRRRRRHLGLSRRRSIAVAPSDDPGTPLLSASTRLIREERGGRGYTRLPGCDATNWQRIAIQCVLLMDRWGLSGLFPS